MNHQALARKYRPQSFEQLLGQSHVLRALINALDSNKMHHAYLFTGTRGVGKTSLARIITKALNCENKLSSKPCLKCTNCLEVANGSFIDLIEIDAASRTGVDDTRDLLEKVQYLPIKGRYKVYLIDEVHMFSKSSFNALLKTLEEPPSHVIFLLATTTPDKIPITVLSRCLQFNLKRIAPDVILNQLIHVLNSEKISFNEEALTQIAKAADGSMRDGLSLLDQAIAFGNGEVVEDVVEKMLGHISSEQIYDLLNAIASSNCKKILELSLTIYELGLDYQQIFDELLAELHHISLAHLALSSEFVEPSKREKIDRLAQMISIEQCQLFFEIGMRAKEDLNIASEDKVAFDMALLKMALFVPDSMLSTSNIPDVLTTNTPQTEIQSQQKKNS